MAPANRRLASGEKSRGDCVASGLVLDLDHDDRVLRIDVADVAHQRGEGALSASSVARPCGRQDVMRLAVLA